MRSVCQLGNLGFSLIALGLFIPLINRVQTNKKEQIRKQKLALERKNGYNAYFMSTGSGHSGNGASTVGAAAGTTPDVQASVRGWELDLVDKNSTAFGTFLNS